MKYIIILLVIHFGASCTQIGPGDDPYIVTYDENLSRTELTAIDSTFSSILNIEYKARVDLNDNIRSLIVDITGNVGIAENPEKYISFIAQMMYRNREILRTNFDQICMKYTDSLGIVTGEIYPMQTLEQVDANGSYISHLGILVVAEQIDSLWKYVDTTNHYSMTKSQLTQLINTNITPRRKKNSGSFGPIGFKRKTISERRIVQYVGEMRIGGNDTIFPLSIEIDAENKKLYRLYFRD